MSATNLYFMFRSSLTSLSLLFVILFSFPAHAQSGAKELIGAWESTFIDGQGRSSKLSMIIAEGYMSMAAYHPGSGEFLATLGGKWNADWENFSLNYEYDSSDSTMVGATKVMPYSLSGSVLIFNKDKFWTRVDDGSPGALGGAWEITGRKRNGEMQDLSARRDGPRKTMKIMSGTRFQWIAFDVEKRQFMATGGGTYRTNAQGLYVEEIQFFSRDASRAGSSLSFDYKLKNGNWIHQGMSSKGAPIHEVWSKRK